MANTPERGEVWLADLGAAAKIRPVLVVSVPFGVSDYSLVQIVPHTTQRRNAEFEVSIPLRFLEPGVFNMQGLTSVPTAKFVRYLGDLAPEQMIQIETAVKRWLGLR